jgi:hypothetical protein
VPRYRQERRRRLGCALSIALLGATTSGRDAAAEDITAVYSAFWAGIPAGQIRVKLRDSDSGYSDEIEISTQGLPRLFTQFRARALAEGRVSADRPAEPSHYLAVYDLWKRRDSRLSMQFVNHAGTMIAERGPDDTSRKPPLAEGFRKNSVDPLSAIERIRGAFRAAGRVASFTIPVYDGARRFDIVGRILPKQNSSDGVLRAELTLRAIAGFKGETSEDGDPDDAPRKVELSVDEAKMVPLSITVPVFSLPLVVQFQRLCAAPDPCTE